MIKLKIISRSLESANYNPITQELFIKFHSGDKIYTSYHVPPHIIDMLESARSQGSYYYHKIKSQFSFK